MPVASELQVFGIQETLKELNDFDPSYRRQITKDIQSGAGNLIVTSARSMIPTVYPLTGMARGSIIKGRSETTFDLNNVNRGVKGSAGLGRGPKDRFIHECQPTDSQSGSGRGRLKACAGDMPQAGNQIS